MSNELIIKFSTNPGSVDENIAQISEQVDEWLKTFDGMTDISEENVNILKTDLAQLRAGKKTIEDERLRIKRKYLEPLEAFEAKVKPITQNIDGAIAKGKAKLDEIQSKQDAVKRGEIGEYWQTIMPTRMKVTLSSVWDDRYLNKGFTTAKWQEDLKAKADKINGDIDMIMDGMKENYDKWNFIAASYSVCLDLRQAMAEWDEHIQAEERIAEMKKKAAEEAKPEQMRIDDLNIARMAEPEPEKSQGENVYDLTFRMEGIPESKVRDLNHFMHDSGIRFHVLAKKITAPDGTILKDIRKGE